MRGGAQLMLEQLLETPLRVGKGLRYLLAQSLQAT